ncbi:MAG: phage major capsid protein [Ruminococcus sp.]|nr:phage major capsid protein [Ruminococcus sp.]
MYNNVKLEKGLYNLSGKTFTEALEALDPSAQYAGTPLEQLDAYQRQLKRFDIRLSGNGCDRVEKFFSCTESAVLFPEFVRRNIEQGMRDSILDDITAVTTKTNSTSYLGFAIDDGETAFSTTTSEGGTLPATEITQDGSAISLSKFGRLITASYEVIRQQKLDVFGVMLRSIGMRLACAITASALNTLVSSVSADGLQNASDGFTYADLAALCGRFTDYDLTTVITTPALMSNILAMPQMEGQNVNHAGETCLPFGAKLLKSGGLEGNVVIGLDKRFALELITSADLIMETDKMIDCQLDRIAVSLCVGFKPLMNGAVKVISWE